MKPKTFHLISLGCAKNTVDSDSMAQLLSGSGYLPMEKAGQAEIIIVNTCGFISPAREESYRVLAEMAAHKRKNQWLIAAGCLTQRYGAEVVKRVPGIDGILGTRRWMDILEVVKVIRDQKYPKVVYHLPETPTTGRDERGTLRAAVQGASAYLKIADGCRRPCAFCAIPFIKGSAVSRPAPVILEEARLLQERGVQEIILIAQDTTDYGHDLGMKDGLATLLHDLTTAAPRVPWIRLMYAFPGYVTDHLIEVMATHPQILPYLDMPLQHAHPDVLKRMRRPANIESVHRTVEKMRLRLPTLALRSTFIVGYPGESEKEFQVLLDFVQEMRFDRLGAFQFSFETGTPSESLGDSISPEVKQERWERLMTLQQGISMEINQTFNGKTLEVLMEGRQKTTDGAKSASISVGRSYRDAPEIDGLVIVEADLPVGKMAKVRITGAMPYDLSGVIETQGHHSQQTNPLKEGHHVIR